MPTEPAAIIRALTMACLFGLLLSAGLRLTLAQVVESLRRCGLPVVLLANFAGVPLLVVGLVRAFQLEADLATGMVLLAAAPFAPVVPVFTKMVRADLALASGLTALFPLVSAFLTPVVSMAALRLLGADGELHFNTGRILLVLMGTITAPLLLGVAMNHWLPAVSRQMLQPVEVISEATGALALAFVTVAELGTILKTGWGPLLVMLAGGELSLLLGYWSGGSSQAQRRVIALGTSNRNIALALLLAVESFPGTGVLPAVVANGLVLILLGLVHVAFWRFVPDRNKAT